MEIQFFYNQSDDRQINKVLTTGETFEGEIRDSANIMSPTILFTSEEVMRYNYCYIPLLQRYYSVSEITIVRTGLYEVKMNVDVLMSFKGHILQLDVIVDKQTDASNGDEYIDDSSLISENVMYTTVYNFPNGFNDYPEYILISAGRYKWLKP